jgi:hypothetical protein
MAKFTQVQSPDNHTYYVNVEAIKYVAQNAKTPELAAIYFVGEHHMPINESAANFVGRAIGDVPAAQQSPIAH